MTDAAQERDEDVRRSGGTARLELILAVVLPACAALYLWRALAVPDPPRRLEVSVGTFPIVVGIALLASALLCAAVTARDRRTLSMRASGERTEAAVSSWRDVLVGIGSLLALAVAFEPLGYPLVAATFVAGIATYYAREKMARNLVVGIVLAVASYVLFTRYLGILLPNGALLSALGIE